MRLPFCAFLIAFCMCSGAAVSGKDDPLFLKGRVLNQEQRPVSGAKIVILDEESGEQMKGESDGKGRFAVKHAACHNFSFSVVPPANSGLSRANFQHVSGEAGKHFIVQLHRGFAVSGRVVADGAGLKGLLVKVSANDQTMTNSEAAHGGGSCRTGKNGEYQMVLTPGQKIIEIKNDRYTNLSATIQQQLAVSGDTRIPDIVLPGVK